MQTITISTIKVHMNRNFESIDKWHWYLRLNPLYLLKQHWILQTTSSFRSNSTVLIIQSTIGMENMCRTSNMELILVKLQASNWALLLFYHRYHNWLYHRPSTPSTSQQFRPNFTDCVIEWFLMTNIQCSMFSITGCLAVGHYNLQLFYQS